MIIDTDKIIKYFKTHLLILLILATGLFSWLCAIKVPGAPDFLALFYGLSSLASAILTGVLFLRYLMRLGVFDEIGI